MGTSFVGQASHSVMVQLNSPRRPRRFLTIGAAYFDLQA